MDRVYTIGHSNHPIESFLQLLAMHAVTAVCDVRSAPYSKYAPQFNYDAIKPPLKKAGIDYVLQGDRIACRVKTDEEDSDRE